MSKSKQSAKGVVISNHIKFTNSTMELTLPHHDKLDRYIKAKLSKKNMFYMLFLTHIALDFFLF